MTPADLLHALHGLTVGLAVVAVAVAVYLVAVWVRGED